MKGAIAAIIIGAALATLTACLSATPTMGSTTPPSSSATARPTPTGSIPPDGLDADEILPTAPPATTASIRAAETLAGQVMTAFARPTVDPTTWINGLYPYLTQSAAAAYSGTDPAQVPVTTILGQGSVVEGSTAYALVVRVPTNIGEYTISLTRKNASDPWLAERITPPQR